MDTKLLGPGQVTPLLQLVVVASPAHIRSGNICNTAQEGPPQVMVNATGIPSPQSVNIPLADVVDVDMVRDSLRSVRSNVT